MIRKGVILIHRWLGLISGLVVFLLAITGCIYVFNQEIMHLVRQEAIYASHQESSGYLPLSKLWKQTQKKIGNKEKLSWAKVYNDPEKSWIFYCYKTSTGGLTYFEQIDHYKSIYVNPYTGKIQGIYNEEYSFFNVVKMLHWSLLLQTPYGQPIVGWSTAIFVIMVISGIILWWPRNKPARKQRFWFRWKPTTPWKRMNYDLHNVLGFYISAIILIIAFTGMVWAFTWFKSFVYTASAGTTKKPEITVPKSDFKETSEATAIDSALIKSRRKYPGASRFHIAPAHDSSATIQVTVRQKPGVYYISHELAFDQYSGELLHQREHSDKNFGEKVIDANYDIHVGAILGLPGKILAFFASLITASLPVTGFMIWWGRGKKKNKK